MALKPNIIIDLLGDEFFVKWVLNPDKESDEYWKRWKQKDPNNEDAANSARELILSFKLKGDHQIPDTDYHNILDGIIQFNNQNRPTSHIELPKRKIRIVAMSAMAGVIILLLAFLGLFDRSFNPVNQSTTVEYVTKTSPSGVKATIALPDGSTVKLNSLSEIRYPAKFSDSIREVFLDGQAFFEIRENPMHPFVVHTHDLKTKVLGTSFDMQAFKNTEKVHVAVLTGRVMVETINGLKEVLSSNEMMLFDKASKVAYTTDYNYKAVMGWKDGIINFEKATFSDVIEILSRWYGVEFVMDNGFEVEGNYTGSFENESLENVLMGISFSSQFDYEIRNRQVLIR